MMRIYGMLLFLLVAGCSTNPLTIEARSSLVDPNRHGAVLIEFPGYIGGHIEPVEAANLAGEIMGRAEMMDARHGAGRVAVGRPELMRSYREGYTKALTDETLPVEDVNASKRSLEGTIEWRLIRVRALR